jgi:cysteine/O-acetylserine efflux protein
MIDLFPLLSYVLISSFTPGPSNISTASMAVLHGYKNTLRYQMGLAAGVFLLMSVSGWLSGTLLEAFPQMEPVLRYAGAVYILYLAFGILKASYGFEEHQVKPLGFPHGLTLQILNPKLIVYAFTVFSGFLASITGNIPLLLIAAVLLAGVSFCATSLWALFGMAIKTWLQDPGLKMIVNALLSLSLVYSAITLTGLL